MCVIRPGNYGRYDVVCREERAWTCKVHDRPLPYDYDDDHEIDFDFPTYGCTCHTTARWKGLGKWRLVVEDVFTRILTDFYMPRIKETLNRESVLLSTLEDT